MKSKYQKIFSKIEESKLNYQKQLLNSSFNEKLIALVHLQKKAKFFDKIKYKFKEI